MSNSNLSVCLAAYNGEKFIRVQVNSIISQLGPEDELIVIDDVSRDSTWTILRSFNDDRVKIHQNDFNLGHVKTFEKAISMAQGEFIFLSDQDDIWVPGRVEEMVKKLRSTESSVVASNFYVFEDKIELVKKNKKRLPAASSRSGMALGVFLGNIPYFGCAMGFNRSILNTLLPFPSYVESHDLWLALVGILDGGMCHLESESLYHRVHGSNLTPQKRRSVAKIAKTRIYFLFMILCVFFRKYK